MLLQSRCSPIKLPAGTPQIASNKILLIAVSPKVITVLVMLTQRIKKRLSVSNVIDGFSAILHIVVFVIDGRITCN